jgi:hypothetical protein
MVQAVLRRLLLSLTVFTFLGGMTVHAVPRSDVLRWATGATAEAPMDCARMNMGAQDGGAGTQAPCKTNTMDCMKQMVCFGSVSLPAPSDEHAPVSYVKVAYWSSDSVRSGRSLAPDPFPPIAA